MNLSHHKLTVEDGVATVLIDRADKGNSLSPEVLEEVAEVFEDLNKREDVKVIVLTGGEKIFSAGFDLNVVKSIEKADNEEFIAIFHRAYRAIRFCRQPVIAAVGGAAIAGGFDLVQLCDIRYASEKAKFSLREVVISLIPVLDPLWRIIGYGNAMEWALTGRMIDAEEAHRVGFVTRLFPTGTVLDEVKGIAREMASYNKTCLEEIKRIGINILDNNFDGSLKTHEWIFRSYLGSDDSKARVEEVLESINSKGSK